MVISREDKGEVGVEREGSGVGEGPSLSPFIVGQGPWTLIPWNTLLAGSPPLLSPHLASAELSGSLPGAEEPSGFLTAPLGSIPFADFLASFSTTVLLGHDSYLKSGRCWEKLTE